MLREKIYLASDHAGFELKSKLVEFLQKESIAYEDLGTHTSQSCDYPDYANIMAEKIDEKSFGVLICGSGIGISIAANRHKNICCALCCEPLSASLSRVHNDANVLALAGRLIGFEMAKEVLLSFINTPFSNDERHKKRIAKMKGCE